MPTLFRKNVNFAAGRLAIAKKKNKTTLNIDGHGLASIDLGGEIRQKRAQNHLQEEMKKRKNVVKGFVRLMSNQFATERLIRLKKFQATKEKK